MTFKFRPSKTVRIQLFVLFQNRKAYLWAQSEDARAAISLLQKEMEKFRAIMADTTERHVDNVLKVGVVLAEVSLISLSCSSSDIVAAGPDVKTRTWTSKISIRGQFIIPMISLNLPHPLFHRVFKDQKKHDEMISDLASAVDRIFPFTTRALEEEVPEGDMDLLKGVIKKLYELIGEVAGFVCDYVKRGRACEFSFQ